MKKRIALLCIVGLCYSCGTTLEEPKPEFPREETLKVDSVRVGEMWNLIDLIAKEGMLGVYSMDTPDQIFVYSTPDLHFIGSTATTGRGPQEIPHFATPVHSLKDQFCVFGYGGDGIGHLCRDTANRFKVDLLYDHTQLVEALNDTHLIGDSILLYNTALSVKKYDLKNHRSLAEVNLEVGSEYGGSLDPGWGRMAANDEVFMVVYQNKNQVDFYSVESMQLLRRLVGDYVPQQLTPKNMKDAEIYYINAAASSRYFYALYKGPRTEKGESRARTLEVYDTKGNPVIRYRFDLPPLYLYPDETNGYIYGYYPRHPDCLLRYKTSGLPTE